MGGGPGGGSLSVPVAITGSRWETAPVPSSVAVSAGKPDSSALSALRRRTAAVLITSQVLGGLGVAIALPLSALLAQEISGSEALSGLAQTSAVTGTALLSVPLAALMSARGRRPGLVLAYLIGAAGSGVVVLAARLDSFPLLLVGMAAFGAASSANLQARFAAADLADPARRARAISTVVWATTVGAVLGPNIAAPAGNAVSQLGISAAAGAFLWACAAFLLSAAVVVVLLRPDPLLTALTLHQEGTPSPSPGGGSLRAGLAAASASFGARLALVTVAASHTTMVAIMVMTPVDMGHHGAGIELIGLVISGHIAGMYAFSPVMGWLSDRLGRRPVIVLAVLLLCCAALLAGTAGSRHGQTAVGLFLLGLGWSAALVSGSALLTDSVPQPARAAVQGLSDLTMNTAAGLGGAVAGLVVARSGYGWLNATGPLALAPVVVMLSFATGRDLIARRIRGGNR